MTWEISGAPWLPQIEHVRCFRGLQFQQNGPSGVRASTGLRRPQPLQSSRLAGSLSTHREHKGRPWSSRPAGSRGFPQREHGTARPTLLHRRQMRCPSHRRLSGVTRPQPGQGDRTMPVSPAAQRASISRSTAGIGARCPEPVSSSGWSSIAQANLRRAVGLGAASAAAVMIVVASSDGSQLVITSTSTVPGSRESGTGQ